MRKLRFLIISYNYPPLKRAGSVRISGWVNHLPENVSATVITRNWNKNKTYNRENYFQEDQVDKEVESFKQHKIIKVPNKYNFYFRLKNSSFFKKTSLNKLLTFFELMFKWKNLFCIQSERSLYYASKKVLENDAYDAIIASGEPFITFYYAYKLNQTYNVPFVLDYRDPWNKNFSKTSFTSKVLTFFQKPMEKKIAKAATLITTVSNKNKSIINEVINQNNKTKVVSNGISSAIFKTRDTIKNPFFEDSFTITFLGTLYEQHNLANFLTALSEIIENDLIPNIKVCFIGTLETFPQNQRPFLKSFESKYSDRILFVSQLDQESAWKHLDISTVLLKFNAFPQEENHFGLKLYEYAAIGKPVLSINSKPEFPKKSGFFDNKPFQFICFSVSEIKNHLCLIYNEDIYSNKISKDDLKPYLVSQQTINLVNYLDKSIT